MELSQETIDNLVAWLTTQGVAFGMKLLAAIVIFVIGRWAAGLIARLFGRALERGKVDATLMKFHFNETIKTKLEAAGCSIPYPQRDVHMFPLPEQKPA